MEHPRKQKYTESEISQYEPRATEEMAAAHKLTADEYARFQELIGRVPTVTELGIVSAMWNEHCSYKSSKKWLKTLPTTGACVVQGPGENAGIVDIGDNQVVVFKMESHNHPSYIEPYQGAATGVGGILRDVFTMGARPIAVMNALRFGAPDHPKTRHLVSGVVAGIGGYGNAFGVPVVGGEVNFDASYNGNCLVNAFAAGITEKDKVFYAKAEGIGLPIVYLGAKTGRDGVGGATMASATFSKSMEEKRPTVQVGDPFTGKCLLEACLELMNSGAVMAIQDMGAAGLTCSAVEMGAKGGVGITLDLDAVPLREEGMTAYEIMLSESQERMLMVLRPEKESEALAIFSRWGLAFARVGETTTTKRFRIHHKGRCVADLPIEELGTAAPEYDRPWVFPPKPASLSLDTVPVPSSYKEALLGLLGGPDGASRCWVFEQYDTLVGGQSVAGPGGDAGIVQIEGTEKALAFTVDVTPRYCAADPYQGGVQAVAECWRNLCAVGATPLALTDNLNFGNPENPEVMGQLVQAIEGIGAACRALSFPVVSGNVSLYNETEGLAILPTPAIAGVGLLKQVTRSVSSGFKQEGDSIFLVGPHATHLGQSFYLQICCGRREGPPPVVDLALERKNGAFVRDVIREGIVTACHDSSDGGLLVALSEMVLAGQRGAQISLSGSENGNAARMLAVLFGEDQSRYVVTCSSEDAEVLRARAKENEVMLHFLGKVGGLCLEVDDLLEVSLEELTDAHGAWFPSFMAHREDLY